MNATEIIENPFEGLEKVKDEYFFGFENYLTFQLAENAKPVILKGYEEFDFYLVLNTVEYPYRDVWEVREGMTGKPVGGGEEKYIAVLQALENLKNKSKAEMKAGLLSLIHNKTPFLSPRYAFKN